MNKMMIDRATVQQAFYVLDVAQSLLEKSRHHGLVISAYKSMQEAIEEDEKTKAGHIGLAKLAALLEQGFSVNGVAIAREREDGSVERGAVTHGGMVLWWHPEQHARIAALETEAVGYQAELAGYEHTIGHLSALVEELRAQQTASVEHLDRIIVWQGERLKKAKSMLSADGFGVPLEAGDNPLLDEINEYLDAVNTEPTAKTVEIDRIKTERVPCWKHGDDPKSGCAWCEKHPKTPESLEIKPGMELYGWVVTGCIGVYTNKDAQEYTQEVARRLGGTSRAFALYREVGQV